MIDKFYFCTTGPTVRWIRVRTYRSYARIRPEIAEEIFREGKRKER